MKNKTNSAACGCGCWSLLPIAFFLAIGLIGGISWQTLVGGSMATMVIFVLIGAAIDFL